jgi:DNA-binding MarR family transcriptional regulator
VLRDLDLVVMEKDAGTQRLYLTETGAELHDEILPIAVGLHEQLLTGFTDREQRQLKKYLRRLLENAEKLQQYEAEQTSADDA